MGYRNLVSVEVRETLASRDSVMANITLILMLKTDRNTSAALKQKVAHFVPKFYATLLILGMWSPIRSFTVITFG